MRRKRRGPEIVPNKHSKVLRQKERRKERGCRKKVKINSLKALLAWRGTDPQQWRQREMNTMRSLLAVS